MAIKDCSNAAKFAHDHGISQEVWDARPYKRWTPEDMGALDEAFGTQFSLRAKVSKVVSESVDGEEYGHNGSGWVMTRYAADPADLPHVYAEIRPDNAVELRPARSHFHGEIEDFPHEIVEVKASNMVGGPKWIHYRSPSGEDRWVPSYGPKSFAMVGHPAIPGGHINRSKDKGVDNHDGVNTSKIHSHVEEAKYLFKPSPKVEREWEHAHDEAHYRVNPESLWGHLAKRHGGEEEGEGGPHGHSDRVKDPDRNYAARIDVHPLAAIRLISAPVVFFGLEGCIKADALLTAILGEGRDASVMSVPSVSLWDCPELALVVSRFLRGKTVIIVVDADGVDNPRVVNQAAMAQTTLLKLGVGEVLVTAPALVEGKIIEDPVVGKLKGVDDFLAAGYTLGDLAVVTSLAPVDDLRTLAEDISPPRVDSQERLFELLFSFSTFAGESGQLHAPQVTVAKVLGVSHQTVGRALQRLVDAEIVTVWADPALLRAGRLTTRQDWRKRFDWEERPFLVLGKQYRATVVRQPLECEMDSWLRVA